MVRKVKLNPEVGLWSSFGFVGSIDELFWVLEVQLNGKREQWANDEVFLIKLNCFYFQSYESLIDAHESLLDLIYSSTFKSLLNLRESLMIHSLSETIKKSTSPKLPNHSTSTQCLHLITKSKQRTIDKTPSSVEFRREVCRLLWLIRETKFIYFDKSFAEQISGFVDQSFSGFNLPRAESLNRFFCGFFSEDRKPSHAFYCLILSMTWNLRRIDLKWDLRWNFECRKPDFKLKFLAYLFRFRLEQNANILLNVRRNAETYLFQSKATRGAATDKLDAVES